MTSPGFLNGSGKMRVLFCMPTRLTVRGGAKNKKGDFFDVEK
jgi:hypothetical protein